MAEAYIIDAVRTPRGIGKQGKGASRMHPAPRGHLSHRDQDRTISIHRRSTT